MERRLLEADGLTVATAYHPAANGDLDLPLLVALHGGTYSSAYFEVAGGPLGSFLDVAGRNGFAVLTIDRPGYGESTLLPEEENTFARQAAILDDAIGQAVEIWPTSGVVLVGHSIGGMISLEIAARHPGWPLLGVASSGNGARIPAGGRRRDVGQPPARGSCRPSGARPRRCDVRTRRDLQRSGPARRPRLLRPDAVRGADPRPRSGPPNGWTRWPPRSRSPVHTVLAEYDALWDSSPGALADYESRFPRFDQRLEDALDGTLHRPPPRRGCPASAAARLSPTPAPVTHEATAAVA